MIWFLDGRHLGYRWFLMLVAFAPWGCTEPSRPTASELTVADSMGIPIRTYPHAGFGERGAEGSLKELYKVGWGGEGPELGVIRFGRILSDGRALAFDATASEFMVLDTTGRVAKRFGRRGRGPGEYQSVGELFTLPDDSVLVYDPARRRLSVLDPHFAVVRSWTSARGGRPGVRYRPTGVTASGQVVWTLDSWTPRGSESGPLWIESPVLVGPAEAEAEDSVVDFPRFRGQVNAWVLLTPHPPGSRELPPQRGGVLRRAAHAPLSFTRQHGLARS